MSKKAYKGFEPKWVTEVAPKDSYRSIFRWGDPTFFKLPKEALYKMMKERGAMTDEDFQHYVNNNDVGMGKVDLGEKYKSKLDPIHIAAFEKILGKENVSVADYDRLSVSYGQTGYDLLRLREKRIDSICDVVLYPSEHDEIVKIVDYIKKNKLHIYVYGGGSSVTRGVEPIMGGVSLDFRRNFNKVIRFNEIDQTITVQAGMSGPRLEEVLNNAVTELKAHRAYTCGHFPQSFEYSSVGGWVVTRGAGQNSTYYGTAADIVISQRYVTGRGEFQTSRYAREATGPNLNQLMMGNEGTFGILTEVTLKVFRFAPENRKRFSYVFKDWDTAMDFGRECMQSENGLASAFRLSNAEETESMLKLYNVDGTPLEKLLKLRGYKIGEMCLFLGFTDGGKTYCKDTAINIKHIAKQHHGMSLTGKVCRSWEKGRFNDPYLRDTLMDFGYIIDTMECSVNWSNMKQVHDDVRAVCHKLPNTIVTTHMSHCYPQGANLYFIFMTHMDDVEEFKRYHSSILDAIQKAGAAMSHHHGIGKMFGPWLEHSLGENEYGVIKDLKEYFDPDYLFNAGGTLGLDCPEKDKRKLGVENKTGLNK
jgi:alkyldihydroxyacetonephosphate synthase